MVQNFQFFKISSHSKPGLNLRTCHPTMPRDPTTVITIASPFAQDRVSIPGPKTTEFLDDHEGLSPTCPGPIASPHVLFSDCKNST